MNTDRKIAVLALTKGGMERGKTLAKALDGDFFSCKGRLKATLRQVWQEYHQIICIMATGIVVRCIAPLLQDKYHDPAVVVCDEQGNFAISLISGHLGGANELSEQVAKILGGKPVITTASDVLGKTALDLWCRDLGLHVHPETPLTSKMGKLVDHGSLQVFSDFELPKLPLDLILTKKREAADLIISSKINPCTRKAILLYPKSLAIGIGCKRDTPAEVIQHTVFEVCKANALAVQSIAILASINIKKDEPGLLAFAAKIDRPLVFFTSEELNQTKSAPSSPAVLKATGAKAVAEPAALLAAGTTKLLVQKQKGNGVTVAIAQRLSPFSVTPINPENCS